MKTKTTARWWYDDTYTLVAGTDRSLRQQSTALNFAQYSSPCQIWTTNKYPVRDLTKLLILPITAVDYGLPSQRQPSYFSYPLYPTSSRFGQFPSTSSSKMSFYKSPSPLRTMWPKNCGSTISYCSVQSLLVSPVVLRFLRLSGNHISLSLGST